MSASATLPVATRLPRVERRAQLLRAAAAAFLAGGYDGTSMEAVADEAGVTRLIVYRHFEGGKASLYRAVLASVIDDLRCELAPVQPGDVAATLLRVARRHPDAFRLLWRHARHEPAFAADAELFRLGAAEFAAGIVGRHIADPEFREWAAATVVDHLHEGICIWLDHGDADRDAEFAGRLRSGARALVVAWAG